MAIAGDTSSTRRRSGTTNVSSPLLSTISNDDRNHQAWIIDVDGVRLVIDGFGPKASETVKAEFRRIVESIDIGP